MPHDPDAPPELFAGPDDEDEDDDDTDVWEAEYTTETGGGPVG